ncbi:variant erythrocyte surface antigen-1 family protein [Babesia divergens]|uniref:Variant erythrocyte surface antigen-1 family protein n=1 Tax=Babesia divergens TaxID=32595 RepID=A0AAD9G8I4_BABDI|nr:variant erythrocyte surface antigen-1 family protein [Babesia divergens]
MRFLCDSNPQSPSSLFRLPFSFARLDFSQTPPAILPSSDKDFLTMGFSKENLPSPGRKGEKLYHAIYGFCKDGFYPLTRLVQFILCVSRHPPETLGEFFAFFKKFVSSNVFKNNFVEWINGEPGTYSGSDLKTALEQLYGSKTSHSSSSHTPANLFSLNDCEGPKGSGSSHPTCGKYLHPLTENAYNIFIDKFAETYLSWVCYRAKDFYSEFKAFYEEAEKKFSDCCSSGSCKIVECPCALPFIYSLGFTLNSPKTLNCVDNEGKSKHVGGGGKHVENDSKCTTKSCSQFLTQLGHVVNGDLFKNLLEEIDNFLWSIRFPFFLFVLAFWAFVISYFLYVQLYKLDLLHIDSHLHLSRSFKILPSTLFSDASSKLKDLSYFTL